MTAAAMRRLQAASAYVVLVLLVVIVVFPFYWMTVTSLKSETQMRSLTSMFWPSPAVVENYQQLITRTDFGSWYGNSITVAVASTFLATAVGTIGAYSLARLRYAGRAFMASGVLITYLVPPTILFIPLYAQIRHLGLGNSLTGLIVTYPSFTVPFVTWLLMGYFESIPEELEEAAMMDGATRFGAFVRVVLPLAAPGVLAAALYAFTQAWNEFLYALVFITDVKRRTLPVGLSTFITGDVYGWGFLMAGAVLTTLPVIAAYIYLEVHGRGIDRGRRQRLTTAGQPDPLPAPCPPRATPWGAVSSFNDRSAGLRRTSCTGELAKRRLGRHGRGWGGSAMVPGCLGHGARIIPGTRRSNMRVGGCFSRWGAWYTRCNDEGHAQDHRGRGCGGGGAGGDGRGGPGRQDDGAAAAAGAAGHHAGAAVRGEAE